MNTEPIRHWTFARCSAVWIVVVLLSGCELARPNFHMNSNSPTPFFGFDLLPSRKTTSLVKPQTNEQVAIAEVGDGESSPVDYQPSIGRLLKKSLKWDDQSERTVVLPLMTIDPEKPIDRGPVELLP